MKTYERNEKGGQRGDYLIHKPPSPLPLLLQILHVFKMELQSKFKDLFLLLKYIP
jgi:hypothetical protein